MGHGYGPYVADRSRMSEFRVLGPRPRRHGGLEAAVTTLRMGCHGPAWSVDGKFQSPQYVTRNCLAMPYGPSRAFPEWLMSVVVMFQGVEEEGLGMAVTKALFQNHGRRDKTSCCMSARDNFLG